MERESVPATERYVKPVSGYALHSHVTAAGCCWNERSDARARSRPFRCSSHLRRMTYNNGKRNHLRRRAFMQNGTVHELRLL